MNKLAYVVIASLAIVHSSYAGISIVRNIAGNYTGLVSSSEGDVASAGLASLDLLSTGKFTGFLLIDGYRISLKGAFAERAGNLEFAGTIAEFRIGEVTAKYEIGANLNPISRLITGGINVSSTGSQLRSTPFVLNGQEADEELDRALRGRQLNAFIDPPVAGTSQEIPGDGFAAVTVGKGKRRSARYVGQLPDAEPYSIGGYLHGRELSLFSILYPQSENLGVGRGGRRAQIVRSRDSRTVYHPAVIESRGGIGNGGSIGGEITAVTLPKRFIQDLRLRIPTVSILLGPLPIARPPESAGVIIGMVEASVDADGEPFLSSPVAWKKRPGAAADYYPAGFNVALSVNASSYRGRKGKPPIDINEHKAQNTTLTLRRGNLSEDIQVILDTRPFVPQVIGTSGSERPNPHHLKLKVDRIHGTFSGRFMHPDSGKPTTFMGAFSPKNANGSPGQGRGSFRGSLSASNTSLPESGSVRIIPRD